MPRVLHEIKQKDGFLIHPPPLLPPSSFSSPYYSTNNEQESTPSSSFSRICPVLLLIIIILAAIFFITGLLHLLVRFFLKRPSFSAIYHSNRYPDTSRSHSFQRQLQQLFRLHDSGLDQAFIDALPVFYYKDIMGLKEPFDCAVCLCEFSDQDKLRLLPTCSHAFHINCIDTWLLSNSTCPLCRGTLSSSNLPMENPILNFDISREISNGIAIASDVENGRSCGKKPVNTEETVGEKKVFSVRLGKFRSMNGGETGAETGQGEIGSSSSSSCHLDARRCYSMGTFQYVVGDSNLQVAFSHDRGGGGDGGGSDVKFVEVRGDNGCSAIDGDVDEKKISGRTRGESFSVSKIWLWSKKSKYSSSSYTHMDVPPLSVSWPVNDRTET